jgi:transcription antitermination protein NusB
VATGLRRQARGYALQVLYALDLNDGQAVDDALREYGGAFELEMDDRAVDFARELVLRAVTYRTDIDDVIQGASKNWRLERMARVDRNILRLAACELKYALDVPVKVVINEAVELAKRFGTGESAAFVNGILDRIAASLGRSAEAE